MKGINLTACKNHAALFCDGVYAAHFLEILFGSASAKTTIGGPMVRINCMGEQVVAKVCKSYCPTKASFKNISNSFAKSILCSKAAKTCPIYFNRAQVRHMQNRSFSNQVFQRQVPEESSNVEMKKLSLFDKLRRRWQPPIGEIRWYWTSYKQSVIEYVCTL